jgi:lysophospholipase L1-like esterase
MSFDLANVDHWSSEVIARFKRIELPLDINLPFNFNAAGPELIAEGDSWFDYPVGIDIIDWLRRRHGFRIYKYARAGDTLENIVFGGGRAALLDHVRQLKPKALLLSAGGNDVAGDEFGSYLNHRRSGLEMIRSQVVDTMIDEVFRSYLINFIEAVANASPQTKIVVHGYGYTWPTGKGVIALPNVFSFIGPWLLPALEAKGIEDPAERVACVRTLITRFNGQLASLADAYPNFVYVDLRHLIDETNDWANELHLKNSAYARVSERIAEVLNGL